ncbi:phosphotransacetylase [Helicobacter pylori OK113]|nr:phosphotransacetylase [Helicobacter pylori OK113]
MAVVQTSLEYLKAMHSHIIKKEAPFAVGLFVGEMLEKTTFFERVSLQATMRIRSERD